MKNKQLTIFIAHKALNSEGGVPEGDYDAIVSAINTYGGKYPLRVCNMKSYSSLSQNIIDRNYIRPSHICIFLVGSEFEHKDYDKCIEGMPHEFRFVEELLDRGDDIEPWVIVKKHPDDNEKEAKAAEIFEWFIDHNGADSRSAYRYSTTAELKRIITELIGKYEHNRTEEEKMRRRKKFIRALLVALVILVGALIFYRFYSISRNPQTPPGTTPGTTPPGDLTTQGAGNTTGNIDPAGKEPSEKKGPHSNNGKKGLTGSEKQRLGEVFIICNAPNSPSQDKTSALRIRSLLEERGVKTTVDENRCLWKVTIAFTATEDPEPSSDLEYFSTVYITAELTNTVTGESCAYSVKEMGSSPSSSGKATQKAYGSACNKICDKIAEGI